MKGSLSWDGPAIMWGDHLERMCVGGAGVEVPTGDSGGGAKKERGKELLCGRRQQHSCRDCGKGARKRR